MIQKAFKYTQEKLNLHVKNTFGLEEDCVVVNNIIDQNGKLPLINQNKIILSLIHLYQESPNLSHAKTHKVSDTSDFSAPQVEQYTIYVLVTSCFDDYNETLKFLNTFTQFFQINSIVNSSIDSDLPKGLNKLSFELQKESDYTQMHTVWNTLGAKYKPSVIYKMRLITTSSNE